MSRIPRDKTIVTTQERVLQVVSYNPETGVFTWLLRPEGPKKWNTRYAGKQAGQIIPAGYRVIAIDTKAIYAHRLVWFYLYGVWPPEQIDHINRDRDDNRLCNLRLANGTQNMANASPLKSLSGIKGVSFYPPTQKWRARISIGHREVYLGYFLTKEAAIKARITAAKEHHGEFANLSDYATEKPA